MFNFDLTGFMFVPFVCYIGLFLLTEGICTYMYVCVCVFVYKSKSKWNKELLFACVFVYFHCYIHTI